MKDILQIDWNRDSLQILYEVSNTINLSESIDEVCRNALLQLMPKIKGRSAMIRLINNEGSMTLHGRYKIDDELAETLSETPIEGILFNREEDQSDEVRISDGEHIHVSLAGHMLAVPVRHLVRTLGVLNIFYDEPFELDDEFALMLITLGQHIGLAVATRNQQEADLQRTITRERNMLANELHDSLAQTLASLRLQTRVLDQSLQPDGSFDNISRLEKIEHSLDQAYKELRQLIAYCHGPLEHQGLQAAIANIVNEFRKETRIHILLQSKNSLPDIPTNMEINAYRIVQEALSNIRKHADAKIVRVLLDHEDGEYTILIENDGEGFDQDSIESKDGEHLGLTIMEERASHLGGELKIESDPEEGTRVELKFQYIGSENTE